jgi:hypothetical protein
MEDMAENGNFCVDQDLPVSTENTLVRHSLQVAIGQNLTCTEKQRRFQMQQHLPFG